MGVGWCIVAIPNENDPVWKISSEKIPHITLLFLGDQTGNKSEVEMASFIKHVADTSLYRFGLDTDRRGILGDDKADVLFFKQTSRSFKTLRQARADMLSNNAIYNAYSSTEQYPEWTPHLTLGYPEAPAKPDDRDYPGNYWVNFDRLALWTGDFEGYEFPLQDNDISEDLAMIDNTDTTDFLAHYGIQGMKWGRRKSDSSSAPKVAPSEDHIRMQSLRDQKKTSGTQSLSNKELQEVITRKNLEKQYKDLSPTTIQRGEKMAGKALSKVGDRLAADAVKKGAALAGGAVLSAVAAAALKGI